MEIQFPAIIFQILNFGVVALVIWKFLFDPIRKVLDQRSERVAQGLTAAESNLKKEQELEKKVKTELQQSRDEAKKIVSEAKKSAEKEAAAILVNAKEQAKKMLESERVAFEAKMVKEKQALEAKLAQLVTLTTKQVLQGALTDAEQKKIIDQQIKQLGTISI